MGRRRWWAAACVVGLAGCASGYATTARFEEEPARAVRGGEALAQRVGAQLTVDRGAVTACFNRLAERLGTDAAQATTLTVAVRAKRALVLAAQPRDASTVVDGVLTSCLDEALATWRIDGDGVVQVPLRVQPVRSPEHRLVERVAHEQPAFQPQE